MVQQLKNDSADRARQIEHDRYFRERQGKLDAREDQRFAFDQDKEKFDRDQKNLTTALDLNAMGAKRDIPGLETALDRVLGPVKNPRMAVRTPAGETFYAPTQQEEAQRKLQEHLNRNKIDIGLEIMRAHQLLPYKVADREAQQRLEQAYGRPQAPRFVQTEQGGMGIDPMTGQTVWTNPELKKAAPADKALSPTALLDKKSQFEAMKTKAQQLFIAADQLEASGDEEKRKQARFQREAARNQLKQAKALARQIKIANPNVEIGGADDDDSDAWPYVK